jgi:hypothetical protein
MAADAQVMAQQAGGQQQAKNWAPTAKVGTGVLAASVTTLVFSLWKSKTGSDLGSAETAAAFTTLITFVIQYLVPERN